MTLSDSHDASAERLRRLMALAPDPDRAERVRVRCRGQLARSGRRAARTAVMTGFAWRVAAPVVVGACCVLYAAVFVVTLVRLQDVFR